MTTDSMAPSRRLSMWTVYAKPADYPDFYVARLFFVDDAGCAATSRVLLGRSLEDIRNVLPRGLTRLERHPSDDPVIVEVWL